MKFFFEFIVLLILLISYNVNSEERILISDTFYEWIDDTWFPYSKRIYEYKTNLMVDKRTNYSWNFIDNEWVYDIQTIYQFEGNINVGYVRFIWNDFWVKQNKNIIEYDNENRVQYELLLRFESSWHNAHKKNHFYNDRYLIKTVDQI